MVARSQTVEDGAPRWAPHVTLHYEGMPQEFIRVELAVRLPSGYRPRRLVIRASQVTPGEVTAALEAVRVE